MLLLGHLNQTGFGNTTQSIAIALEKLDPAGALMPLEPQITTDLADRFKVLLNRSKGGKAMVHCSATRLLSLKTEQRPAVVSTTFETDTLHQQEFLALKDAKALIFNCNW